jgi:hypothetical protein
MDMVSFNQAISLGTNHWTNTPTANAVIHPIKGKEMKYMDLIKDTTLQPLWKRGFGKELGRLFQVIRDIHGTHTCFFVELTNTPKDRQITYGKFFCDYKPHKKKNERTRLIVGGDSLS